MICPYCKGNATLKDNAILYGGRSFGKSYICKNYPKCDTYVGSHKESGKPLGTLADAKLRELRCACHAKIDPMWKDKQQTRKEVYAWLSEKMGVENAHIGNFTKDQCLFLLSIFCTKCGVRPKKDGNRYLCHKCWKRNGDAEGSGYGRKNSNHTGKE